MLNKISKSLRHKKEDHCHVSPIQLIYELFIYEFVDPKNLKGKFNLFFVLKRKIHWQMFLKPS